MKIDIVERLTENQLWLHRDGFQTSADNASDAKAEIESLRAKVAELETANNKIKWASQYAKVYEELRAVIDGGSESMDHAQAIQAVKGLQAENAALREVAKEAKQMRQALIGWRSRAWPGIDQEAVVDRDFPATRKEIV